MDPAASEVPPNAVAAARAELETPALAPVRRFVDAWGILRDHTGRAEVRRAHVFDDGGVLLWFRGDRTVLHLVVDLTRDGDAWRATFAQSDAYARVALRVQSRGLDPDAISAVLGMAPSRQARAGHALDGDSPVDRITHLWIRDALPGSPAPLEEKLDALLRAVEPYASGLDALRDLADVDVSVAWHGDTGGLQGFRLAPGLTARLAVLGLSLDLELYAESPDRGGGA